MQYFSGRGNLACTIFVPFDCTNKCPFCTSKEMYGAMKDKYNLNGILELIDKINYHPYIQEFVLTGGEPTANLELLKIIVNACKKRVFINTTLPITPFIDETIDFINNCDVIEGISVSRHIGFNFHNVASGEILSKIKKNVRINTVITHNFTFENFEKFVGEYGKYTNLINLRADYTKLDTTTLKSRDNVVSYLMDKYLYVGGNGCLVCNTEYFSVSENVTIAYHRGLMFSSIACSNKTYINDVIITPDGILHHDWDFDFVETQDFIDWCVGFKKPNLKIIDLENSEEVKQFLNKL